MCDASGSEKSIAKKVSAFSDDMVSQAKQIFGNDNSVFNGMMKAYSAIVNNGVNQHGFNQAELNAKNSAVITNNANQFRNVAGAVKSGQAAFGGGNEVSGAGVTTGQNLQVAQAAAANTANGLNQVVQEDYATGRDNFFKAAEGEQQLPSVFNNLPGVDNVAKGSLDDSLKEQQSLDAQSGWWKAPVMGLVNGGLSLATGGLSSLASGGSFMKGVGSSLDKMSG
jgi:hypothetical protein